LARTVSFSLTTTSSSARSDQLSISPCGAPRRRTRPGHVSQSLRVAYTLREAALHHGG
jgi:hypothetical protein